MSGPERPPSQDGASDQTDPHLPRIGAAPPPAPEEGLTDPAIPRVNIGPDRAAGPGPDPVPPPEDVTDETPLPPFEAQDGRASGRPPPTWPEPDVSLPPPTYDDGPVGPVWWRRPDLVGPLAALLLLAVVYLVDLVAAGDAVPRHTVVAGVDLGGLDRAGAAATLAERVSTGIAAPRIARAGPTSVRLDPAAAGIALDVEGTVARASRQPWNPLTRLSSLFSDREVDAVLDVDDAELVSAAGRWAADVDVTFVEGTVLVDGATATVVQPIDGLTLDQQGSVDVLLSVLRTGNGSLTLPVTRQQARVSGEAAQATLDGFVTPALAAPVTLTGFGGVSVEFDPVEIGTTLRFDPADDGSLTARVDATAVLEALGPEARTFAEPPVTATFDVSGPTVVVRPSSDGNVIDINLLTSELERVLLLPAPRSVTVTVRPAQAALTTEQAQALGIVQQVSSAEVSYPDGPTATNVRAAGDAVDGVVVRPGESFSLNNTTGPRVAEDGYVVASSAGASEPVLGEGISPLATALYNAVYFAGLEVLDRVAHPVYDASFPAGRDAMVRMDTADLLWRNNATTGILVLTQWTPTGTEVQLWGTQVYDVDAAASPRVSVVPAAEQVSNDPACVPSAGSDGFALTVTRIFRQGGAVVGEQDVASNYAPAPQVTCVQDVDPTDPSGSPEPTATDDPVTSGQADPTTSSAPTTTSSAPAPPPPPPPPPPPLPTTDPPPTTTDPPPPTTDPPPTTTDPPPPPPTTDPPNTDPPSADPQNAPAPPAVLGSGSALSAI